MKSPMFRAALAVGSIVAALAATPASADVWFLAQQWLVRLSPTGGWLKKVEKPFGVAFALSDPSDSLEINPVDGTVWVVDKGHDRLVAVSQNGTPLRQIPVTRPWGIALDPLGGALW